MVEDALAPGELAAVVGEIDPCEAKVATALQTLSEKLDLFSRRVVAGRRAER